MSAILSCPCSASVRSGRRQVGHAWNLFQAHQDDQVAYVDIDQLKMLGPRPDDRFSLAAAHLGILSREHRRIGMRAASCLE